MVVEVLNAFTIECSIRLQKMTIDMVYPVNATRLGFIHFTKPELLTKVSLLAFYLLFIYCTGNCKTGRRSCLYYPSD